MLGLKAKLEISSILEGNQRQGRKRVESLKLDSSLAEVAWVFTDLCKEVPHAMVAGPLEAWDGEACGALVAALGYPQYSASFAASLRGSRLAELSVQHLCQLGVAAFDQQRAILSGVRELCGAYRRREEVRVAREKMRR